MNVGYICTDVDVPVFGAEGCSIHVRELVRALVAAGHPVSVLCTNRGAGPESVPAPVHALELRGLEDLVASCVAAEPVVQAHNLERDLGSVLRNALLVRHAEEILLAKPPDVLYERYALFGTLGVTLAERLGVPLILELNAPLCLEQDGYEKFTLNRTAAEVEAGVLRRADAVVAVSGWLRDFAVSRGADPDRVHVIPNAVGERFVDAPAGDEFRARHGLDGQRVVGYLGSFQWWHDLRGLVRGFASLASSDRELLLVLVGDGPERPALQREAAAAGIADQVVFTGNVPHEQVPSAVAAFDVAAVPYRTREDFYFSPLKLFECMAAGRPTVAASVGQIADVVAHEENGLLYEPGDDEGLAAALSRLLYDAPLAQSLGANARRTVLAEHTWAAVAGRIVRLGEELRAR